MPKVRAERGFTLMEMMFALIIGAVVMAPLYLVTRGMSGRSAAQQEETQAMQRARMGLELLVRDFRAAGLFVSPATGIDPKCDNRNRAALDARYRNAVVHLNRNAGGMDALLLSGNFLGGQVYRGYLNGSEIVISQITEYECTTQFDKYFAFAHLIAKSGNTLDLRVTEAVYSGSTGDCTLTVDVASNDTTTTSIDDFAGPDYFYVAANQTALYFVETVDTDQGPRRDLVRYFVEYINTEENAECSLDGATDADDITWPGDSKPIAHTRQVLAEYVQDFQVWLRLAEPTGTPAWPAPRYHDLSVVAAISAGDGFLRSNSAYIVPTEADGDVSDDTLVSCAADCDAEKVRSAIIRLAVRTERTDQSIDFRAYAETNSRIVRNTLREYDGGTADRAGALYKVKTVAIEAMMPNLAARSDLLNQ